jgi:hypothetical protein
VPNPPILPGDDPRDLLAAALEGLTAADLPRLAAAWTPELQDELRLADLVLFEHERGDLTHVVGPLLDRIPLLGAVVEESEDLAPHDRAGAEAALEVIEGAVMALHAADLLTSERRARLAAPWLAVRSGAGEGMRGEGARDVE